MLHRRVATGPWFDRSNKMKVDDGTIEIRTTEVGWQNVIDKLFILLVWMPRLLVGPRKIFDHLLCLQHSPTYVEDHLRHGKLLIRRYDFLMVCAEDLVALLDAFISPLCAGQFAIQHINRDAVGGFPRRDEVAAFFEALQCSSGHTASSISEYYLAAMLDAILKDP